MDSIQQQGARAETAQLQSIKKSPSAVEAFLGKADIVFKVMIGTSILLSVWMFLQQQADAKMTYAANDAPLVSVQTIQIMRTPGYKVSERFTGRVEAVQTIDMAFEQGGSIQFLMVDEGDRVKEGDVLAQLDIRTLKSELREQLALRKSLAAALERNQIDLKRERTLDSRGFAADQSLVNARLNLAQASAAIEQADARVHSLDIAIQKASLKAPFSGVVGARSVDVGAIVQMGESVFTLFDDSKLTVRVGLPPDRSKFLSSSTPYSIVNGDKTFKAKFIGARQDLAQRTRTLEARFEIEDETVSLAYGQLVNLTLDRTLPAEGYWLPMSALSEGERGLWSVLVVHDDVNGSIIDNNSASHTVGKRVSREHVDVIHADGTRAYVQASLPEKLQIVETGSHRLVAGQLVKIASVER